MNNAIEYNINKNSKFSKFSKNSKNSKLSKNNKSFDSKITLKVIRRREAKKTIKHSNLLKKKAVDTHRRNERDKKYSFIAFNDESTNYISDDDINCQPQIRHIQCEQPTEEEWSKMMDAWEDFWSITSRPYPTCSWTGEPFARDCVVSSDSENYMYTEFYDPYWEQNYESESEYHRSYSDEWSDSDSDW